MGCFVIDVIKSKLPFGNKLLWYCVKVNKLAIELSIMFVYVCNIVSIFIPSLWCSFVAQFITFKVAV